MMYPNLTESFGTRKHFLIYLDIIQKLKIKGKYVHRQEHTEVGALIHKPVCSQLPFRNRQTKQSGWGKVSAGHGCTKLLLSYFKLEEKDLIYDFIRHLKS